MGQGLVNNFGKVLCFSSTNTGFYTSLLCWDFASFLVNRGKKVLVVDFSVNGEIHCLAGVDVGVGLSDFFCVGAEFDLEVFLESSSRVCDLSSNGNGFCLVSNLGFDLVFSGFDFGVLDSVCGYFDFVLLNLGVCRREFGELFCKYSNVLVSDSSSCDLKFLCNVFDTGLLSVDKTVCVVCFSKVFDDLSVFCRRVGVCLLSCFVRGGFDGFVFRVCRVLPNGNSSFVFKSLFKRFMNKRLLTVNSYSAICGLLE